MTSLPPAPPTTVKHAVRWGIRDAGVGIMLALGCAWLVGAAEIRAWRTPAELQFALSYLATWVPLLSVVFFASYVRGAQSFRTDFGLRVSWLDVLYGLTLGFFLRSIATVIEIAVYGRPAGGGITFGPTVYDVWWVLLAIIAPVLLAPVIEELFFRGLLQRAVLRASRRSMAPSSRLPAVIAVTVSSLVFAAVHVLQTGGGAQAVVVGISTLVLGIGLGALAAVTGRLGGAIIAHIVFNGLGVLGTLL